MKYIAICYVEDYMEPSLVSQCFYDIEEEAREELEMELNLQLKEYGDLTICGAIVPISIVQYLSPTPVMKEKMI